MSGDWLRQKLNEYVAADRGRGTTGRAEERRADDPPPVADLAPGVRTSRRVVVDADAMDEAIRQARYGERSPWLIGGP